MVSTDNIHGSPVLIADQVEVTYHINGGRRTTRDPDKKRGLRGMLGPSVMPAGKRRKSISRSTRTVTPYFLPALQASDIGHSQPSCIAGQRYLIVSRAGS